MSTKKKATKPTNQQFAEETARNILKYSPAEQNEIINTITAVIYEKRHNVAVEAKAKLAYLEKANGEFREILSR